MRKVLFFCILFLFIFSNLVVAKGGGSSTISKSKEINCDERLTIKDRIQCKLERNEEDISVYEACKVLTAGSNDCVTLHKRVYSCYEEIGEAKDKCFKAKAKFNHVSLEKESKEADGSIKIKNYILFLLYDLEEMVEDSYEANKINSDEASDLIVFIIEAKQQLLMKKPNSEIKSAVNKLKNRWNEVMK